MAVQWAILDISFEVWNNLCKVENRTTCWKRGLSEHRVRAEPCAVAWPLWFRLQKGNFAHASYNNVAWGGRSLQRIKRGHHFLEYKTADCAFTKYKRWITQETILKRKRISKFEEKIHELHSKFVWVCFKTEIGRLLIPIIKSLTTSHKSFYEVEVM